VNIGSSIELNMVFKIIMKEITFSFIVKSEIIIEALKILKECAYNVGYSLSESSESSDCASRDPSNKSTRGLKLVIGVKKNNIYSMYAIKSGEEQIINVNMDNVLIPCLPLNEDSMETMIKNPYNNFFFKIFLMDYQIENILNTNKNLIMYGLIDQNIFTLSNDELKISIPCYVFSSSCEFNLLKDHHPIELSTGHIKDTLDQVQTNYISMNVANDDFVIMSDEENAQYVIDKYFFRKTISHSEKIKLYASYSSFLEASFDGPCGLRVYCRMKNLN